jgi:hypothetical protein
VSIEADARALVTGFGSVAVRAGVVTTRGLLDDQETLVDTVGGSAVVRARALLVVAADLPALQREDVIQIATLTDDENWTSYRVADTRLQVDGILKEVLVVA